jgi:hypothetical protein
MDSAMMTYGPCDLGDISAPDEGADWTGRGLDAHMVREYIRSAAVAGYRSELNGAHILGTLSLRDASTPTPVSLTSCWIENGIEIGFATLSDLNLEGSRIGRTVGGLGLAGRYVKISGDLGLGKTAFEAGCELVGATIKGDLNVTEASVGPRTSPPPKEGERWALDLAEAHVTGDVTLEGAHLAGGVSLDGTTVSGQLNLLGVTISASPRTDVEPANRDMSEYIAVWGQRCKIGESVLAHPRAMGNGREVPASFSGLVSFICCSITGSMNMRGASLRPVTPEQSWSTGEIPRFGKERQRIALDLYGAKIGDYLRLEKVESEGSRQVDLRECTVNQFLPGETLWLTSTYCLSGLTYKTTDDSGRTRRKWIKKAEDGKRPGPYLVLAAAAGAEGERRNELKAKIRASSAAAHWLEKGLLGWIRYGYRPYLVAVPLVMLAVVCFWQVERTMKAANGFAPVVVDKVAYSVDACDESKFRCLDPKVYAIDAVVPLDLHQVSTWRPNRTTSAGNWLFWIITISRLTGWALAGVFLAAVGGILKRT